MVLQMLAVILWLLAAHYLPGNRPPRSTPGRVEPIDPGPRREAGSQS